MEENTQEKNLIAKKESFFSKVKNFFKNLFKKKEKNSISENVNEEIKKENVKFKNDIKVVEEEKSEEIALIELQKRYRRGEIVEKDLTDEQIDALCDLYDRQIEALKKVIAEKQQKLEKKNA